MNSGKACKSKIIGLPCQPMWGLDGHSLCVFVSPKTPTGFLKFVFLQLTANCDGFAPLKWLAIHFQIISQNTYYVIQYSSFLSLLLICILQTSSKLLYWYKNNFKKISQEEYHQSIILTNCTIFLLYIYFSTFFPTRRYIFL